MVRLGGSLWQCFPGTHSVTNVFRQPCRCRPSLAKPSCYLAKRKCDGLANVSLTRSYSRLSKHILETRNEHLAISTHNLLFCFAAKAVWALKAPLVKLDIPGSEMTTTSKLQLTYVESDQVFHLMALLEQHNDPAYQCHRRWYRHLVMSPMFFSGRDVAVTASFFILNCK